MKAVVFLISIICLKAYSQDCHKTFMNYSPKETNGNYSVYEYALKKSQDSILLVRSTYDSIELMQTKIMYAEVHTMAGSYVDPGVYKIKTDTNGNVLCLKKYCEGETYNGRYKYIGLDECTYDNLGNLISESSYGTSNVPITFIYADSTFEQAVKHNYSHRASPDCISKYHYADGRIGAIENYKNGSLVFKNELRYTSLDLREVNTYKSDGTLFSTVELSYFPKGFTQTLYFFAGEGAAAVKQEDSYYWKYTKERGRVVELEYGKNGIMIDKNKYTYDSMGRIATVKMFGRKGLIYIHKYFYEPNLLVNLR